MEAQNAAKCSDMMASSKELRGKVVVPKIDYEKTSARVLTMEYIEGVSIADKEALRTMRCSSKSLAHLISEAFNQMIFRYGFVHADPHPANMLVRRAPESAQRKGWQLVLLDHGLYRELDDHFRLEYAKLWKSLIFADIKGIEESAKEMNAGHAIPLFAGMITQRQWKDITQWKQGGKRLQRDRTPEEKKEIQAYVGQHAEEIGQLLGKLPRQLLLLLKTNDCLRAVDKELGAGFNSFVVTARECSRALNVARSIQHPGRITFFNNQLSRLHLELRLSSMQVASLVLG